jgi:hypothetical protein
MDKARGQSKRTRQEDEARRRQFIMTADEERNMRQQIPPRCCGMTRKKEPTATSEAKRSDSTAPNSTSPSVC